MELRLHVRGDRACFKRPEFAEDMVSYDVITPMAARGLFEAIHAPPGLRWRIDEIEVLRPIRSTWMSLAATHGDPMRAVVPGIVGGQRDRRMANVLSDVGYVITAHVMSAASGNADEAVQMATIRRRISDQSWLHAPYLGLPVFPAQIALIEAGDPLPDTALRGSGPFDLGWMLYDREASAPRFFRAIMIDGVIDLRRFDSLILAG